MSKKTYIFLHERDGQTEGSGRMQKVLDTLVGAANQMEQSVVVTQDSETTVVWMRQTYGERETETEGKGGGREGVGRNGQCQTRWDGRQVRGKDELLWPKTLK